jgi:hypothetical protein
MLGGPLLFAKQINRRKRILFEQGVCTSAAFKSAPLIKKILFLLLTLNCVQREAAPASCLSEPQWKNASVKA